MSNASPGNAPCLAQSAMDQPKPSNDLLSPRFLTRRMSLEDSGNILTATTTARRNQSLVHYPRSYDGTIRQLLRQIPLPQSIICCVCHTYHPRSEFSPTQLNNLRQAIYESRENIYDPHPEIFSTQQITKCIACSQSQVVEKKCGLCGQFRGLRQFSKNQRSRDISYCMDCMEEQMSTDPDAENARMQSLGERTSASDSDIGLGAFTLVGGRSYMD
ncbi:uncharacterized protein N7511_001167 [Penicillium nucicola]|uniref:uncharacterized protein n=1 Tax=Penicillium nucicola TaxID=1850975 RepID=UPI0025459721|nr:uncharacterized protein N7511_001167 [Penicillium nucicola]KAJ5776156.1 hypothetical protein N7511_001167 [Penicillium nucicola]